MNKDIVCEEIEEHSLCPFLPWNAKVLILGSFPPKREKWGMDFYYPNFQNDMWRILALVFFNDKEYFLDESKKSFNKDKIIDFLNSKKIAISDSAVKIKRLKGNASDKYLEIVESQDWEELLSHIPVCQAIISTGEKSIEILNQYLQIPKLPKIGEGKEFFFKDHKIILYRAPSTSKAYPKSIIDKAQIYKKIFDEISI